jgi:hypothetical protein
MNRIVFGAIMALLVVTLALPALTFAGNDGPSATGNFSGLTGFTRFIRQILKIL